VIVVVDTHAHLYPCARLDRFLESARQHLSYLASHAATRATHPSDPCAHVLCLTERASETAFAQLADGRLEATGWRLRRCAEPAALRLRAEDSFELTFVAGRQVATRERLEALALGLDMPLPDGLALSEALSRIREARGIAVLPWSPGKWLGHRGHVVRDLLLSAKPGEMLLGDSALRPQPGIEPRLHALGRRRGIALVAGSDPLPLPGEERHIGRYATVVDVPFSPETPIASLRTALCAAQSPLATHGTRRSWLSVAVALARHAVARN
jgi:hypothetical protein